MKKFVLAIFAALLVAACQSNQGPAPNETAEAEPTRAPETAAAPTSHEERRAAIRRAAESRQAEVPPAPRERPELIPGDLVGQLDSDGPGMTYSIDGSSIEAYQQSLELIAAHTSRDQFDHIKGALGMLQIYDPAGWRGMEALITTLDGQSGEDIVRRAQSLRGR